MIGAQKVIGWALFAIVIVVLIIGSAPDRGRQEGYQGSYLGRSAPGPQAAADQAQALGARTATQRY
jgi:hypothetical protein